MMKLWKGKFSDETGMMTDRFCASIGVDKRLWKQDILSGITHAKELLKENHLTQDEYDTIVVHLQEMLWDAEAGRLHFTDEDSNIQTALEQLLYRRIGDTAKKLQYHSDPLLRTALDLRMYQCEAVQNLMLCLDNLIDTLTPLNSQDCAKLLLSDPALLPSFTQMIAGDKARLSDSKASIDAAQGAKLLCDSDFAVTFISACAVTMMHLCEFVREISCMNLFAQKEGKSAPLSEADLHLCDLIYNKAAKTTSDLTTVLTVSRGLPLSSCQNLQACCEPLFDSYDTLKSSLQVLNHMLQGLI